MPRNEYKIKDRIHGKSAEELQHMIQTGEITADDLMTVNGVGLSEDATFVDLSQEAPADGDVPGEPTLADLRKGKGGSTTEAHVDALIAKHQEGMMSPTDIKKAWADDDHVWDL